VLVFAAPDPPSLEKVTKTTRLANEAGCAVVLINPRLVRLTLTKVLSLALLVERWKLVVAPLLGVRLVTWTVPAVGSPLPGRHSTPGLHVPYRLVIDCECVFCYCNCK
jgi:hypothetical protein